MLSLTPEHLHLGRVCGILIAVSGTYLAALAVVAGFMSLFCACIGAGLLLIRRLVRDHRLAKLYRQQQAALLTMRATGYKVTYRDGRKVTSLDVDGNTDAEALKNFLVKAIPHSHIISLEKN